MATSESSRARAPRGAKAVVSAFMAALDGVPDARRVEVAKAAQISIRDELKSMALKAKEAARKPAGRKPVARKAAAAKKTDRKAVVAAKKPEPAPAPLRRAKRAPASAVAA